MSPVYLECIEARAHMWNTWVQAIRILVLIKHEENRALYSLYCAQPI